MTSYASNPQSGAAQVRLRRTTDALSKSFERLASGLRINSASDDPAGLALADAMKRDATLASAAVRNISDGISLAATADSALEEIGNNLSRMAELANQSSNGIYTQAQRSALSSEFLALGSEIERISRTTTFNNIQLLSNSSSVTIQAGIDGTTNSQITISNVLGTLNSLGIGNAGGSLTFSIIDASTQGSTFSSAAALSAVRNAINTLSSTRGTIGAAESRLNSALNTMIVARENYTAAESRIRDLDVAQEVAEMVRLQVLQQAATAVLAQANQQPATALALLQ